MWRIVVAIVSAPIVAFLAIIAEMRVEILFHPEYAIPDRGTGLEAGLVFQEILWAWLYSVAVALVVSRKVRFSSWFGLAGAAVLLAMPPWLVGIYFTYDAADSILRVVYVSAAIFAWPFAAAVFFALMCIASKTPLERTREE